jgi:acetoin utilization deacetylase AcuC-like enzyme
MSAARMPIVYSPMHKRHAPSVEFYNGRLVPYPEVPARIESMRERFEGAEYARLITKYDLLSKADLAAVHSMEMLDYLESTSGQVEAFFANPDNFYGQEGSEDEKGREYFFPIVFPTRPMMARMRNSEMGRGGYFHFDTEAPIGLHTWDAVLHAASVAAEGVRQITEAGERFAFSLCRPPGHHAGPDFMGGFCFVNNAALAAVRLLDQGRTAIVDIDYHHGNGTQAICWDRPEIFYGSIHGHPDQEYPYYSGYEDETGGPGAEGTNVNLPLRHGATEADYLAALSSLLAAVEEFSPASLVISVGFDTFEDDPLGFFNVTREGYTQIGRRLAEMGLPTLFIQEGGYDVAAHAELGDFLVRGALGL